MTMEDFVNIVSPGTSQSTGKTWCKIEYKDGKLSITGVEGPLRNGDCRGACGQIDMHPWAFDTMGEGWTPEMVLKFREIWDEWHLNDLRGKVREALAHIRTLQAIQKTLARGDHETLMFCQNARLKEAFNDGADEKVLA